MTSVSGSNLDSVLCGLQCPCCPQISWCSTADPAAGQDTMFVHLLTVHADGSRVQALALLAKCAEVPAL